MKQVLPIHSIYRKSVFWILFLTLSAVMLIVGGFLYFVRSHIIFTDAQNDVQSIATKTASLVDVSLHEQLQDPEQMKSDAYTTIENQFQQIMAANPQIDDIYTLRPTDQEKMYTFIVSGKETFDQNTDGIIDESEIKAMLGEEYDATDVPQLNEGLKGPAVDQEITYDKWGEWLSGYAPLRDSNNEAVAVLGVDFAAQTIIHEQHSVLTLVLMFWAGSILLMALVSFYLSWRLARPIRTFSKATERVLQGDLDFTIPEKGPNEEKVYAILLNNLIDAFGKESTHKEEEN